MIRRRPNQNRWIGSLLLLYIGTMIAANLWTSDIPFSEPENRVLEQRPAFSLHALLSGPFTSDYERYTSDQFAIRNTWVGMKTDTDRFWGKNENNGVFLGKDGYLFERYMSPSAEELAHRVKAIQVFDQATPDLNKVMMLAPTAVSLLADKLPAYAPVGDQKADLAQIAQLLPETIRFVDVYAALDAQREQVLFYKTDHHWTTRGAYYAYRALCKQLGIVPYDEEAYDIHQATDAFYGSLSSKSGFRHLQPDRIELYVPKSNSSLQVSFIEEGLVSDSLYEPSHLQTKDKYAVFLNGNHALVRITTDVPTNKKLLVVKDSYANSMLPFLTMHFAEIDVVDLRYYDRSLLQLVQERQFQDMLLVYNINTFFQDPSILNISEELQ